MQTMAAVRLNSFIIRSTIHILLPYSSNRKPRVSRAEVLLRFSKAKTSQKPLIHFYYLALRLQRRLAPLDTSRVIMATKKVSPLVDTTKSAARKANANDCPRENSKTNQFDDEKTIRLTKNFYSTANVNGFKVAGKRNSLARRSLS